MEQLKQTNTWTAIKKAISLLTIPLLLAGLFSCSDDSGSSSGRTGSLMLSLRADTTFRQTATTKAAIDDFQSFLDPGTYAVNILQEEEEVIRSFPAYQDMPEEIKLESGAYKLMAYKGDNVGGGFTAPYFEGAMNFSIESEMLTPIEVICRLANTRVTVDYAEDFREVYHSYAVHFHTAYMTDTLTVGAEETRAAYFRSDAKGTDLEIVLELKRLEDETVYYYKPDPIPIEPRQNVNLLFKTDGEAISGIGLTVTLNDDLDETIILDMDIPGYAFDEVDKPTWGKEKFELELSDITYRTLQKKDERYYLDYIVPASVDQAILQISRMENGDTTIEEYDLASPEGADAARLLGITLTDQANDKPHNTAKGIRNGRIHFTEALALLPPSKSTVEYSYTLYIIDALPIDPNTSETTTLTVKPNAVGASQLTGMNIEDYTVMARKQLPQDMAIVFDTDAGIKTAVFNVYRNGDLAHSYSILSDELPEGIVFEDDQLSFDRSFTQHLEPGSFGMNAEYTFTVEAIDQVDEAFLDSPLSFSVTVTPFVEIIVPTPDIWGWKAKAIVEVDGLTEGNKGEISLALSEDNISFTEQTNYTVSEGKAYLPVENLTPGKTYYIKATAGSTTVTDSFATEESVQLIYGDMNTWYLNSTTCTYNVILTIKGNKFIPTPVLNDAANAVYWETNNQVTAGKSFHDDKAANHPKGCFPTVVYEKRDEVNQFAAVIRSVDATAANGRARGELVYAYNHASRPSSVSFEYAYEAFGDEVFVSDVIVYSGDAIIGMGTRPASAGPETDYTLCTVPITYTETALKATAIRIFFASSDKETDFGTTAGQKISVPKASATAAAATYPGTYEEFSNVNAGSTLRIDNVILNYAE